MEIRKDFKEIENELIRASLIAAKLKQFDGDWIFNKNEEDMQQVYGLPHHFRAPLERVYSEGRQMEISLKHALTSFNDVLDHSTIYSWVKRMEDNWIGNKLYYESIVLKAHETLKNLNKNYNSITQMIYTLNDQIKLLDDIEVILTMIKSNSIYLKEEKAINKTIIQVVESIPVDMASDQVDVFISYSSEDKIEFVNPLIEHLKKYNITLWFDKNEILWGDSLVRKINQGLSKSKFAIFLLSTNFINKNWPQSELEAVLNIETNSGEVRVLPLIIGSEDDIKVILGKYPLLASKKYLRFTDGLSTILDELRKRLNYA